tara:strand:+ start:637 stop:1146 length:510 start_codon:yes stop_codon:yes gene_type:complete
MAYQKLQAGKAWSVYTSDNTNIPNIGVVGPAGATDATGGANKYLIDGTRTGTDTENFATLKFTLCGLKRGMIIVNTTDGTQSELVAVINDTTIEVKEAIFAAQPKNYAVYGGVQEGAVLYIGGAGNIKVTTVAGDIVTFNGVLAGSFFPVNILKVFSTGTSATNIIALW